MDLKLLDDLLKREAEITTEVGTFTVTYSLFRVSMFHVEQITASPQASASHLTAIGGMVRDAILDWTLTYDGEPVPVTTETINSLPYTLVLKIMETIMADYNAYTDDLIRQRRGDDTEAEHDD